MGAILPYRSFAFVMTKHSSKLDASRLRLVSVRSCSVVTNKNTLSIAISSFGVSFIDSDRLFVLNNLTWCRAHVKAG